jgi:hypothetical protein
VVLEHGSARAVQDDDTAGKGSPAEHGLMPEGGGAAVRGVWPHLPDVADIGQVPEVGVVPVRLAALEAQEVSGADVPAAN